MPTVDTVVENSGLSYLPDSRQYYVEGRIAQCDFEILRVVNQGVFGNGQTSLGADLAPFFLL